MIFERFASTASPTIIVVSLVIVSPVVVVVVGGDNAFWFDCGFLASAPKYIFPDCVRLGILDGPGVAGLAGRNGGTVGWGDGGGC
jgi:hypothetical protein